MYKQIIRTILLVIISFNFSFCQQQEVILKEISPAGDLFKVSMPEDWIVEIDSESKSVYAEHPILKYKFKLEMKWDHGEEYQWFTNEKEITPFIEQQKQTFSKLGIPITNIISRGCNQENTLTICRIDFSGIDVEDNHFISSDYYITGQDEKQQHIKCTVRVSQKEFTKNDNKLIRRILTSITF